jgi:DNA-binding NarL/FixJ family response regulator
MCNPVASLYCLPMKTTLTLDRTPLKSSKPRPISAAKAVDTPLVSKKKVFIVDDHAILRDGLTQLINAEEDLCVCGQAENAQAFLSALEEVTPDIAIVDVGLPTMNGVELIKHVKGQFPKLPILVLSMYDENLYAERVLRAGARGYLMKQFGTARVREAIRDILNGKMHVSEKLNSKMMNTFTGRNPGGGSLQDLLSDREFEVFELIGHGSGTRQSAAKLNLSVKTIESYREHIKEKMGYKNGTELVQQAIQWVERRNLF